MITIKVPATSANMGVGFDSIGIAVQLYLELDVLEETNEWIIEHDIPYLPNNDRNLIIQIAKRTCHKLKPHRLRMRTNIPTTRGLGSSSSAIIAGIELANYLGNLNLSIDDKIQLATKYEGHPDNVAPALIGNLVISAAMNKRVFWSKVYVNHVVGVACIPAKPLSTKESRGVLPDMLSLKEAAKGSAISNVFVSQIARGYLKYIRHIIESDVFHEPYRKHLVPELVQIRELLKKEYTYGTYLSGAGPTVMTLVPPQQVKKITHLLTEAFPEHDIVPLEIDRTGVQIIYHD
ncbi:homoserine kinase [Granulicatella sp. zg-84]|uniref:homoserine kinase n=1 Tax=Granulicatella sp. zg-84 TaxID=2678503 RepID=UPI0019685199|nr:homoserine kinase [Granulicatella sp. zg-84]